MRSLLKDTVKRVKEIKGEGEYRNSMLGRVVKVGQYQVKVERQLGSGGFAEVYSVLDVNTRASYALKHCRTSGDEDAVADVRNEVAIMQQLKGHKGVLTLHAVSWAGPPGHEDEAYLLMDLCSTNLVQYAAQNGKLAVKTAHNVMLQVCDAVAWMHSQKRPLAHRDIKAENVLATSSKQWVLCDFGSATTRAQVYSTERERALEEERIRKSTTPSYRAPEMWDLYNRQRIDTKVDIWALGCLLYWLLFGKLPFTGENMLPVMAGNYDIPRAPEVPSWLIALVRSMLTVDPAVRPDIQAVLTVLKSQGQQGLSPTTSNVEELAETGMGTGPPTSRNSSRGPSAPSSATHSRRASGDVGVPSSQPSPAVPSHVRRVSDVPALPPQQPQPSPQQAISWQASFSGALQQQQGRAAASTTSSDAAFDPFNIAAGSPSPWDTTAPVVPPRNSTSSPWDDMPPATSTASSQSRPTPPQPTTSSPWDDNLFLAPAQSQQQQQRRQSAAAGAFQFTTPFPADATTASPGPGSSVAPPPRPVSHGGAAVQVASQSAAARHPAAAHAVHARGGAFPTAVLSNGEGGGSALAGGARHTPVGTPGGLPLVSASSSGQQLPPQATWPHGNAAPGVSARQAGVAALGMGSGGQQFPATAAAVPKGFLAVQQNKQSSHKDTKQQDDDPFAFAANGLLPSKAPSVEQLPLKARKGADAGLKGPLPPQTPPQGLWRTVSDPPPLQHWM